MLWVLVTGVHLPTSVLALYLANWQIPFGAAVCLYMVLL